MPFAGRNHLFLRENKFFHLFQSQMEKKKIIAEHRLRHASGPVHVKHQFHYIYDQICICKCMHARLSSSLLCTHAHLSWHRRKLNIHNSMRSGRLNYSPNDHLLIIVVCGNLLKIACEITGLKPLSISFILFWTKMMSH